MSDLSDDQIDLYVNYSGWSGDDASSHATRQMAEEIRRHRSAQRADAERVRSVVRDAVYAEMRQHDNESIQSADWVEMRNSIADRVAAELATTAPVPGIDAEDRAALQWAIDHIRRTTEHQDGDAGAAIGTIERLRNGAVLPAPDVPATASAPVLSAEEREALEWLRSKVGSIPYRSASVSTLAAELVDRLLGGGRADAINARKREGGR